VLPQEALPPQEEEPAGPSPDEILERIDAVVADRTKSMEQSLRAQYDDEIAALRAQLEGARQAQLEAQRRAARTPTRPPQASPAGPIPTASSDRPAATTRSPETTTTRAAETAAPSRSGTAGAARPESETSPSRPATGVAESTAARPDPPLAAQTREPTAAPASAPPQSQQPASSALAQGSTPKPRVRRGDLVPLGPDVAPPKLVGRLEPRYPMMAQKLKKEASLYVSVLVDEEGRVAQAKLAQDEVGFGFDEAALQAARRARFEPARKDGVVVKTWTNLKLEFRLQ
jgi:protein TonB